MEFLDNAQTRYLQNVREICKIKKFLSAKTSSLQTKPVQNSQRPVH